MTAIVPELLGGAQSIQSQLSYFMFTQILGHPVIVVVSALQRFLNICSQFRVASLLRGSFNHQIVATLREDLSPEPHSNSLLFLSETLEGGLYAIGFFLAESHSNLTEKTLTVLVEVGHDTISRFFWFVLIEGGLLCEPNGIFDFSGEKLMELGRRTVTCCSVSGDLGE